MSKSPTTARASSGTCSPTRAASTPSSTMLGVISWGQPSRPLRQSPGPARAQLLRRGQLDASRASWRHARRSFGPNRQYQLRWRSVGDAVYLCLLREQVRARGLHGGASLGAVAVFRVRLDTRAGFPRDRHDRDVDHRGRRAALAVLRRSRGDPPTDGGRGREGPAARPRRSGRRADLGTPTPRLRYSVDGLAPRLGLHRALTPSAWFERTVIKQTAPAFASRLGEPNP